MMGYGWGAGMGALGGLMMILFWVFIIAGIVWLVLAASRGSRWTPQNDARRILDERFAHGEIDAEEYRTRLTALGGRR